MGRTKICTKCGIEKSIDDFYTAGRSRKGTVIYRGRCKECERLESRIPIEERIVPPKYITDDIIYKKCQQMAYDAHSRIYSPSRQNKSCYRNLINPFDFENTKEMYMYLFNNCYDEIKSMIDNNISPSVDRIDSSKGYSKDNIRILSHKENTERGVENRKRKVKVITPNGKIIIFNSVTECVSYFGYPSNCGNMIANWVKACNGGKSNYKVPKDYFFEYIN